MSKTCIVNLIGGRGYTGSALLTLIAAHPKMDLGVASSRSDAGLKISDSCDGWPDDGRMFMKTYFLIDYNMLDMKQFVKIL